MLVGTIHKKRSRPRYALLSWAASFAAGLAVIFGSFEAQASSASNTFVTEVTVDSAGIAYFRVAINLTTAQACSSAFNKNALAFDAKTDAGKALLPLITKAYVEGTAVDIAGNSTNTCIAAGGNGTYEVLFLFRLR
jgi:hypothetical protein